MNHLQTLITTSGLSLFTFSLTKKCLLALNILLLIHLILLLNDTFGEIRIRMGLQCILNDLLQFLGITKLVFIQQINLPIKSSKYVVEVLVQTS